MGVQGTTFQGIVKNVTPKGASVAHWGCWIFYFWLIQPSKQSTGTNQLLVVLKSKSNVIPDILSNDDEVSILGTLDGNDILRVRKIFNITQNHPVLNLIVDIPEYKRKAPRASRNNNKKTLVIEAGITRNRNWAIGNPSDTGASSGYVTLSFTIEQTDEQGNITRYIPVFAKAPSLPGSSLSGVLDDGDEVKVAGWFDSHNNLIPIEIHNLRTDGYIGGIAIPPQIHAIDLNFEINHLACLKGLILLAGILLTVYTVYLFISSTYLFISSKDVLLAGLVLLVLLAFAYFAMQINRSKSTR